ncbi:IS66 family insertion sequence element accessory protein TnpA [Acidithiobacillus sp. M4-SHS-6]|uniref:IS66 family insertion sequence element accessory protein TnpA n=1 Tax=Acidithiobacillus sp. M4-SHS-6 TaxID=3383024 RepID=UPI0039BE8725
MTKEEKVAYWRQRVDAFQASGLSVKHFCAQAGYCRSDLALLAQALCCAIAIAFSGRLPQGFVPVTLAPVRTADAVVDIQLLSGRHLKLAAPVDAAWLHTLVRVLESPCG